MSKQGSKAAFSAIFIFVAGISAIGLFIPRHATTGLALAWFTAGFGYFWLCRFNMDYRSSLAIGIMTRALLFFNLPSLSDDVYRFIWDGTLLANGISPFADIPANDLNHNIPGLTPALFERLNSPGYFTVYPPLNQLLFWLSVKAGLGNWLLNANVIRIFLVFSDIGAFIFLRKLLTNQDKNPQLANWYFLNPLLILEGTGNLHFEGMVVWFLVLALYELSRQRGILSGVGFGLAIGTKLLPLIYLPAIFLRKNIKNGLLISGTAMLTAVATLLPLMYPGLVSGIQQSLGLYFHKFEFNASLYYLLRTIGFSIYGYNIIGTLGPALSVFSVVIILALAYYGRRREWPLSTTLLFTLSVYLLLSTTVHPWYILPLVALGILSGYYFPLVWSFLIFVSYFGYSADGYEPSWFWIVLEYTVVIFFLIYELLNARNESRI